MSDTEEFRRLRQARFRKGASASGEHQSMGEHARKLVIARQRFAGSEHHLFVLLEKTEVLQRRVGLPCCDIHRWPVPEEASHSCANDLRFDRLLGLQVLADHPAD